MTIINVLSSIVDVLADWITVLLFLSTGFAYLRSLYLKKEYRKDIKVIEESRAVAKRLMALATDAQKRSEISLYLILEQIKRSERRVSKEARQLSLLYFTLTAIVLFSLAIPDSSITGLVGYITFFIVVLIGQVQILNYSRLLSKADEAWSDGVDSELLERIYSFS